MISIIIPHCPSEYHDALLEKCRASLVGADEVIIVANELNTIGYTKAVNLGLRVARGDFLMVVNNDVEWTLGDLKELCDPNAVTSPKVNGRLQRFWGCFFVIPRGIYEKLGPLDERFYLYYSDTDYIKRMQEAGIIYHGQESCNVDTKEGQTTQFTIGRNEIDIADQAKFKEKWGIDRIEI